MKKISTFFFIFMMITITASAFASDTISTTKCVRLCLRVVPNENTDAEKDSVDAGAFDAEPFSTSGSQIELPPDKKGNMLSQISGSLRNIFSSFLGTSGGMIRKY